MTADTVQLDALEAGDDVATDLVSAKHYQQAKLVDGTIGATTPIAAAAGTAANALRTTLASDDPAVALLTTIDSDTNTIQTDTTSIDGKITACDTGAVVISSGTTAVTNAGTFAVQVSDTSFAVADGNALGEGVLIQGDDGTDRKNINVHATTGDVQVDVTNTVTVDGTITAVTDITNPITANPASGTIDTVTNLAQMGAAAISMNTGVRDAGTQRVTIATNDSVPVTGTVTANLSATDNAVLDNIQTSVDTVAAAVSTEMQVDVVGALPAGTNAIGKLAENSGVDIGDVDVTSVPGSATSAATAFDSYTHASINLTTGANQVLVSSAANKQIWVYGIGFTCGTAGTGVSFQDELDVAVTGIMTFAQYGGMAVNPTGNFEMPLWKLGTDKDLEVDITTGDVDGWICYAIVSV